MRITDKKYTVKLSVREMLLVEILLEQAGERSFYPETSRRILKKLKTITRGKKQ